MRKRGRYKSRNAWHEHYGLLLLTKLTNWLFFMRLLALAFLLATNLAYASIALSPDVTQATIDSTICVKGYTKTVRPATSYTRGVKLKLLREAGLSASHAREFELDHIVSLNIGGHPRSLNNLMLQEWDGENGAHRKDKLEVKLQCLVCTGALPLAEAQKVMYSDWLAAYEVYMPLRCHR